METQEDKESARFNAWWRELTYLLRLHGGHIDDFSDDAFTKLYEAEYEPDEAMVLLMEGKNGR